MPTPEKLQYVMFFDNSVRGLSVGAPVEFKGIRVGSVLDIRLEFDAQATTFIIPVLVEVEPERIVERGADALRRPRARWRTWSSAACGRACRPAAC